MSLRRRLVGSQCSQCFRRWRRPAGQALARRISRHRGAGAEEPRPSVFARRGGSFAAPGPACRRGCPPSSLPPLPAAVAISLSAGAAGQPRSVPLTSGDLLPAPLPFPWPAPHDYRMSNKLSCQSILGKMIVYSRVLGTTRLAPARGGPACASGRPLWNHTARPPLGDPKLGHGVADLLARQVAVPMVGIALTVGAYVGSDHAVNDAVHIVVGEVVP